jgi:tetratricopeptide (TPR) repeat protein
MCRFGGHVILALLCLFPCVGIGAEQEDAPAGRYFSLLQAQPGNSYLFDRFYNTWLDTKTVEKLEAFLKANLEQNRDIAGRLLLAFFYERQGQDSQALAIFRDKAPLGTVTAEYLFYKARAEARNLDLEKAISDLLAARRLPCVDEIAEKTGQLLGELYVRTNQRDKAAALWKRLLASGDKNHALYEDLIELQVKEGLFDDALQTCDELILLTKDPYKAVMRRLRKGDVYQYKADTQRALNVYAETLEMVGQGSWLENQICSQIEQIFHQDDNAEGLRAYLADLVQAFPKRIGLKKRLANLLLHMGQTDEALTMFQEILQVTPGDKAQQQAYVKTLTELGQLDKAIKLLEQLVEANPQDSEMLISLAELYQRDEQGDRAASVLTRFLDLSDKTEQVYLRISALLEQYKLDTQAHTIYEQMLKALPESLTARQVYAEFLYRVQQKDKALALFQAIAERGDLQSMMRASNAAGTRGHYDQALVWVEARYPEFADDVSYLNHLCKIALRLEQDEKAIRWARHQLNLATDFPTIRAAISQVMAAAGTGPQLEQLTKELEAKDTLTIQQQCLLSELLETQDQSARADAVLARAAAMNPDIALRQQIQIYRLRRNWTLAAASMESLIDKTGRREVTLIRELIELYQKCVRFDEALKWVLIWEKLSPASAAPRLCHSDLLMDMGQDEEAIKILDVAGREFEGNTDVLVQQAKLYTSTGQYDEAQRIYWRLYESAESATEKLRYVRNLSALAEQTGKHSQLIERLKGQQQKNRTAVVPLLGLAEVYKQMGKYEERRQALLEATRLKTDDIQLIYELASVEEAQGDWKKAIETLERAMTLDPSSKTRLKIARLLIRHGSREEGFRILMEVAGGDKMDPRDAQAIGANIMSMGMWDAAISFLQRIVPLHPQDYKLHYQYALALEEGGRDKDAMEAFIDLLGLKTEIPGNKAKTLQFSWKRQGLDTNIQQILPADAIELLRLSQYHASAYQHQRQRMSFGRRRAVGPASTALNCVLPPTIEDLQAFALCHILTLAGNLGDQGRAQVRSDLYRSGVANSGMLMKISALGITDFHRAIDELAPHYPEDRAIQAAWIMNRIEGLGCTIQEAKRVFDMFEKTHPRLAVTIGLRCYGRDRAAAQLFTKSLKMLQAIPDPGYYEVMSIAYILRNEQSYAKLTRAQRSVLDRHLIAWYGKLKNNVPNRVRLFNYVATLLVQRADLSAYVRFLDDEIARHQSPASSVRSYQSAQPMIWHLACPPGMLPDFPDHVVSRVQGNSFHFVFFGSFSRETTFDSGKLGKYLDQAKDPILRILIALTSGQYTRAESMIKLLLKKDPTCLAAYMLGAGLAADQGKPLEAIALLDRARSLPMSPHYLRLIDGALVASAMELDQATHSQHVDIGKKAAIRLLSQRITPQQREELLVATEALGLTEQSENLKSQIAAANKNMNTLARASGSRYMQPVDLSLIKTFLERGKTDSALRLALGHLAGVADNSMYPRLGYYHPSPEQLIELLRKHKVVDALIKLADPPVQARAHKLTQYGRVCELLGRKQEAMAAYERAIARDPKKPTSRIQLALMLSHTDPKNAATHLLAIDKSYMSQVGNNLANVIRDRYGRGEVDQALDLVHLIRDYLDVLKDPGKINLDWVDQVAGVIAEQCRQPDCRLNHLYENQDYLRSRAKGRPGQSFSFSQSVTVTFSPSGGMQKRVQANQGPSLGENVRASKQRRTSHNQLCEKMIEIPQLAEVGFSRLVAEAKARDAITDEHTELARRAVLAYEPHRKMGHTFALPQRSRFRSGRSMRLICPAEYLSQQAYRTGTLDRLYAELLPQLKQQNKGDQAAKLQHMLDLYIASPENFFDAAERFLGNIKAKNAGLAQVKLEADEATRVVIDAYLERRLDRDQDMGQFILARIKGDIAQNRFVHQGAAEYWLDHLLVEDKASARAFLDSVVALYESPKGRISGLDRTFQRYVPRLNAGPDIKLLQRIEQNKNRPSRMSTGQNTQTINPRNRTLRSRGSRTRRRRN